MRAKAIGRICGSAILIASFISANTGSATAVAGDTRLINTETRVAAAEREARRSFPLLLSYSLSADSHIGDAAVRVAIPNANGGLALIWLTPTYGNDNIFMGIVANSEKSLDEPISFTLDQVRDWYAFGNDGKIFGSFTARALLPILESETAAQVAASLTTQALPTHW